MHYSSKIDVLSDSFYKYRPKKFSVRERLGTRHGRQLFVPGVDVETAVLFRTSDENMLQFSRLGEAHIKLCLLQIHISRLQ
jgi:hypothetical protein